MRRLEHAQRLTGSLVAVGWTAGALLGTFRDPDPWGHNPAIIVFRLAFCGLILFTLLKRVTGRRVNPLVWAFVALLCVDGVSRARSASILAVSLLLVVLCLVGYGIERRLQKAVQPGVEADGPSARGLTP
jgi:hypothetical protein